MGKSRLVLGILGIIFLISCNDNNPQIAEGLFGKDRMKVIKDSLVGIDIEAYTISDEDAVTSAVTNGVLGINNDPVFGKTKAGFAFQLRTPGKYVFEEEGVTGDEITEDDLNIDSAFLFLAYKGVLFDSTQIQNLNVYELGGAGLDFTYAYRANDLGLITLKEKIVDQDFNYEIIADSTIITTRDTLDIKSKKDPEVDSIEIKIDTLLSKSLKIQIPNEYAKNVFIKNATPENYKSQKDFLEYFKGIYIDTDDISEEGALYEFNINEGMSDGSGGINFSRMVVSYSFIDHIRPDSSEIRKREFGFYTNENSARVNFISHDFSDSSVGDAIGDKGDVQENDELYIKGGAGTKAKLYIPKINDWKDSTDIAINKAELELSVMSGENVPDKLIMVAIDKENNPVKIPDYDLPTFNGIYDKEDNTYKFNITFYLQKIIKDKGETINNGFLIYPDGRREDPRRVIIANPSVAGEKDKRIKLSITYTKI